MAKVLSGQGRYIVRTVKTLGIATAMALCLIAFVGAASASADNFKVSYEPGKWNGAISGEQHRLHLGEDYECTSVSFSGETKTKSFEKLAVSPELSKCLFRGLSYVNWTMNGCKFLFHAGGGSGTIDITSCTKPMSVEASGCRIEIGNQRGLGPVTYKNSAKLETITASAGLSGITYTRSGFCSSWPAGTFSDGTYSGSWTISHSTTTGIPGSTWIESAAPAPISAFAFEEAPATVKSELVAAGWLWISGNGNALTCNRFNLSGSSASALTGTLSFVPVYKECKIASKPVPDSNISAGSCSYIMHADGGFDIGGEGCASNPMTFTSSTGCVVTVGPQSFSEGLTFKSEGAGKLQTLSVPKGSEESAVFTITSTATGAGCPIPGIFTGTKLNLRGKLAATNSGGAAQGIWRE
jgi:hypothetical protein